MSLAHRLRFLHRYLREPDVVGAIAPSSQALARALCEPFRRHREPAKVLEVGAGTGAVTRHIGRLLSDDDEFDICEIQDEFADILERTILTRTDLARAVACGRARLLRLPIQELPYVGRYDFVISGLPLTAFEPGDVREVLATIRNCLKPGGVLSYFEYVGLRRASRVFAVGKNRNRIRKVSAVLSRNIRNHQFERTTVLQNFPPAYTRHLRFDEATR